MKTPSKFVAIALATSFGMAAMTLPASATKPHVPPFVGDGHSKGAYGLICIGTAALGLIWASMIKGNAHGYPTRWYSALEAEQMAKARNKQADLTTQEAQLIGFTCGLGAFPVVVKYRQGKP